MLVGTDVCVPVVFVWEETGVPGGNPPVWLGDTIYLLFNQSLKYLIDMSYFGYKIAG